MGNHETLRFFVHRAPDLVAKLSDYLGQLTGVFPNAFAPCETVLHRSEAPGVDQDVVFQYPAGSSASVALPLIAARAEGEVRLVEFTCNTTMSEVPGNIK